MSESTQALEAFLFNNEPDEPKQAKLMSLSSDDEGPNNLAGGLFNNNQPSI